MANVLHSLKSIFIRKGPAESIFYLLRPYKLLALLAVLSLTAYALMEGVTIALAYIVLSQTLTNGLPASGGSSAINSIMSFIARGFGSSDLFLVSCALLIISYFLKACLSFLSQFSAFYLSSIVKKDLHNKIFGSFLNSDYPFFFNHKHGWLMHRAITVPLDTSMLLDYIPRIAVNGLRIAVIMATLFLISPRVTIFIIALGFSYIFVTKFIGQKVSYGLGKEKVLELQKQNELASEAFTGIKQIKIFMFVNAWLEKFMASALKYSKLEIKEAAWIILPPAAIEFIIISSLTALLMIAKMRFASSFVAFLPMIAIFGYSIQRIVPCFNLLGAQMVSFFGLLPTAEAAHDVLTKRDEARDGTIKLDNLKDSISFRDVCFSYPGRDRLFNGLTFELRKGTTVALVGSSGSGKSTIADLITRLLRVSGGKITIDGIDINDIRISSWLGRIGLVTQDSFIFHGTVKENIALGVSDIDMASVINAAKEANAHEFISAFPQGYDTVVGDRGIKLSGGQRQRIAIARAVFRKPDILILDEATNSLDSISEAAVQRAIDNSARGRTVIIIAHKISAIKHADKILVLKDGKISEEGRHEELMKRRGFYHDLHETGKITT
jgi:ATP-binding cassette, subfamily B, bacterial